MGIPLLHAEILKSLFSKQGEKITVKTALERYIRYMIDGENENMVIVKELLNEMGRVYEM